MKTMLDLACALQGCDKMSEEFKELLGQGLFYYCAGVDASPIVALGEKMALYVYVDTLAFMHKDFGHAMQGLCNDLAKRGFTLTQRRRLDCVGRLKDAKNAELSSFHTEGGTTVLLLYVQGDAVANYRRIFGDGDNFVMPKCICNYREELRCHDILRQVEKRVEYILGHCFNSKYRPVDNFDYLGSYGSKNEKMTLYKRHYYYLF